MRPAEIVALCRVSGRGQDARYQWRALRAECARLGIDPVAVVIETNMGWSGFRPALDEAIEIAKATGAAVAATTVGRFIRTEHYGAKREKGLPTRPTLAELEHLKRRAGDIELEPGFVLNGVCIVSPFPLMF